MELDPIDNLEGYVKAQGDAVLLIEWVKHRGSINAM